MPEEGGRLTDTIYEPYALQSIHIPRRKAASDAAGPVGRDGRGRATETVLPAASACAVIDEGLLSDAQLESVIYAGEAHSGHLAGAWTVDETCDVVSAAPEDAENAVRFRRGWFLGDGTGCGKGRQVAGIILDNWLQGRRRAIWISKSDKLIEDAQRDWSALGQEKLLDPAALALSAGHADPPCRRHPVHDLCDPALAGARGQEIAHRRRSSTGWAEDFDGVIVFDEAHAMANAAGGKGERGDVAPSQQGKAGLRLQHALPDARVVYVSATGATAVENLAYAQRLGIWGSEDFPFANRAEFVAAIEDGGVAAMEVLARDLKSLGLYAARSLSYDGVEYDLLEHELTDEQIRIYNAYADAFQVIHNNLDCGARGGQHHQRVRHAEPQRQVGGALGLREHQAALLQPSHHLDDDADADRRRSSRTAPTVMRRSCRSSRPARR